MCLAKQCFLLILGGTLLLTITSFRISVPPSEITSKMVDPQATRETKALYENLKKLSAQHMLFGQQDAFAYGVFWKDWHKHRSDVHDIIGKHPAVFGWELSKLGQTAFNIDSVNFVAMQGWMKQAYKMGGVNTISWHMDNFVTGGNSWEVGERVVETILPGGSHHDAFKAKLDLFADYVNGLESGFLFRKKIPIIFRPWHEHTGSWFWWGRKYCTPEQYKALWRFTVEYLRDTKGLHHLLYCYAPDIFEDENDYLERYPGDEYVDILGLDDYHDVGRSDGQEDLIRRLRTIVQLARDRDKFAALTETGYASIPLDDWWTESILQPIKNDSLASQIAWLMVWRNARLDHHYAPFPGHSSENSFRRFASDRFTMFAQDLPNLYRP